MDYDDNDFQSQNLHLAGEGSSKFPPALRPYALSKFDFDESLQGHLRFDSLVETEVFLGIESNEDNQWIGPYSRGSSEIVFSSSAAESCSISRHNNVWSEATSSESVEMLLKSVGQEEFIPRQTVIEESNACDELAILAKQMEPNTKSDDNNTVTGGVVELQPMDRIHENLSGFEEDAGRGQAQAQFSEVHDGVVSIPRSVYNSGLSDIFPNVELPVPEGSCLTDGKSNNSNKRGVETVADESLGGKIVDDPSASGMQTCITASSVQSVSSTYDVLSIQNVQNPVIGIDDEKQGALHMQIDKQDMGSSILNEDSDVANQNLKGNALGNDVPCFDNPHGSDSKKGGLEGGSVVDSHHAGVINFEESSDLEKTERHSEVICIKNPSNESAGEDAILHKDAILDDQSSLNACDFPNVVVRGDSSFEGQVVEINNSNSSITSNLNQDVNNIEANKTYGESSVTKEKELSSIGHQMDEEIITSKSEEHMSNMDHNNGPKIGKGNCDSKVGGFCSLSMASSPAKSCILGEATEISGNNEVDRQDDHETCHQNVAKNDKESIKVHSYASQVNSDVDESHLIDKGVGSSSHGACTSETLPTSTTSVDDVGANESASQVISENTGFISCEKMDVSPLKNTDSTDEATDHNDVQKRTHVESVLIDEKQQFAARTIKDAGISPLVGSSERECAPCPLSGTERQETADNCLQVVGTSNVKTSEPQETHGGDIIQDCTEMSGFSPVLCESGTKKDDQVTISFDKHEQETVLEDYEAPPSKVSVDVLLSNKGSASVTPLSDSHVELHEIGGCPTNHGDITCSASTAIESSSQTEKDGSEVQASADQSTPVSEFTDKDAMAFQSVVAHDPKGKNEAKADISLTCVNPVADLSMNDVTDLTAIDVDKMKSVPATLAGKSLTVLEGSPLASGLGPKKTKGAGDASHGSPKVFDGDIARSIPKATPERKTRRASQKTSGKESSRKRNNVKEATPVKQSERGDKSSHVSLSPPPGFQLMQTNELQQYGRIDSSSTKQFALLNASTSSLPDLNTSTPAVLFQQQPFTDLQQVQLRAQIFVYGALIQGTAPDEAYMISAFGGPDGGRSMWEKAWHACMERQNGQKSQPINQETPQQSRSGHKPPESAVKQSALQGKGISSPLGRANTKATSTIVNSPMPLSSPLWSVPTPSCDSLPSSALARGPVVDYPQAFASMHPYQTPPLRNFLGHNTPWVSQSPLRGPWIASPTPMPDNNSHPSASPVSDTIKLNSVKGSSLPPPSGVKTPGPPASSGGPPCTVVATASLLDTNNVTPSNTRHSSDPKPKKRKKSTAPEDLGQKALQLQSQLEATPAVSCHVSTPVAITNPAGYVSKTSIDKSIVSASLLSPASQLKNDRNVEKRILSDESLTKVKEARVHAEEAAALSAASVNHSLEIWNQLDKQKNSGLVPDIEAKLASAAVAIAAAAAVAKAAAAAANVASNAALQAKMMADEALASSGYDKSCQSNGISLSINLGKATPASILKGDDAANSSSSIMLAAKEAVRRKVEAASAATQRAENMDAIVKAAELAAEAVSQAGKIVTMGDHLPLSDLVKAGPEGYWKTALESSQQFELLKDMARGLVNIESVGGNPTSYKHSRDISSDRIQKHTTAREKPTVNDVLNETSEEHMRSRDGISSSITIDERDSRGLKKGQKVSNSVNPVDMVPEIEMQSASVIVRNGLEKLNDNIKEGSLVEIFKDGEGFKEAWFTANVLSLNDNKAYVCYNVLLANEGSGPLKEWVSLEGGEDKPPRIRIARPVTGLNYEGTRKRRRAAMGDYAWSVGNRVDAWIQESWWEGVVIEKSKKDETTLTVHFPAHGETSVVKAWQLRPSLAWKDGKWIDSSSVEANDSSTNEGDTPHEKRPRFNSPAVGARGKDKMSKSIDAMESVNPDELRLLDLTENEKVFNIGKNNRNENKSDTQRMPRTGLQKEGSRVIFGVPKPGKKRKFMEVSKHYVADKGTKINDGNDSVKLANFLVPQGLGTRGWKTSSKNDGKEKRGADSKVKTFKSGKPLNVLGRTIPQKDSPFVNTFSHPNNRTDRAEKAKDFASHSKNASESESQLETASYSESDGAAEGPTLYSSLATSTDASSKKTSTSRASKGKLAPAGGKLGKIEEEKALNGNSIRSASEAVEPRRSNRRIQPTSRLLEGLQSSLIISKIPSVSHDKGHKNQNRNASRGNNQC